MIAAARAARRRPASAVIAIRAIRRRELLRISVADLLRARSAWPRSATRSPTSRSATLEAALAAVTRAVEAERGEPMPTRMAIVAMGRYGGFELGYGSDADVMFVHDPLPGRRPAARRVDVPGGGQRGTPAAVAHRARDPALEVDAGPAARGPAGAAGADAGRPTRPTTASGRRSGRPRRCCGPPRWSATRTCADGSRELIDPLRFPDGGLSKSDVVEIRRIKARVDSERLPRGADPATHFKLGRGGLSDVEWTVQLLQMEHAGRIPELRTTKTLEALQLRGGARPARPRRTRRGWPRRGGSRAGPRNATVQVRGKPSDQLPRDARERAAVAAILRLRPGESDAMVNDYLKSARRARPIVDRVFWG